MAKIKNKGKKNLSDQVKEKAKKKTNPFEVHVNRQKFSVVGRKLKHDKGLPGIARSKAFSKRKATLLHEYQVKNKSNKFMDRRIGEKNKYMTEDEKLTARFAAERMKAHKNTIYNLADDEVLTHRGHVLSEIEKFDDPKSDDEEDEKGKLDAKFVTDAHFGGFLKKKEETESQAKNRKELIDQLIAESKKRRYEKQKMQDETLELTDKLDSQWKDLLPIVSFGNSDAPPPEKKSNEVSQKERAKIDSYDLAVQELKFEARGRPSEKLKTEEEIAKEELEKLEKLEAERKRRMQGLIDEPSHPFKHRSADDLDDGLDLGSDIEEEDNPENKDIKAREMEDDSKESGDDGDEEEVVQNDDEESGEEDEESVEEDDESGEEDEPEEENSNEDDSLSDLILEDSDNDQEEEVPEDDQGGNKKNDSKSDEYKPVKKSPLKNVKEVREVNSKQPSEEKTQSQKMAEVDSSRDEDKNSKVSEKIRTELLQRKIIMEMARKELPYTFEVPDSSDGFSQIMDNLGPEHQSVVVERMIKCTHPSLKSGNKERLQHLFGLIIQHLHDCAWASDSQRSISGQSTMTVPRYCFAVLGSLINHLYDLAQSDPENAASCVSEVLKEKFSELGKDYPGPDTLVYLRLIPQLFPASDFRHPVTTPAFILMTKALRSCKVRTRCDVTTGLFISTILVEGTYLSKRFSPEVINFLLGVLYLAIPKAEGLPVPPLPPPPFRANAVESNLLVVVKNPFRNDADLMPELKLEADDFDGNQKKIDESFKIRAVNVTVNLIECCVKQLKDLPSVKEIFLPFLNLIPLLPLDVYPEPLVEALETIQNDIRSLKEVPLERLAHAAKKPKALKLYEPAIADVFDGHKKRRVMSREKAEHEKLLHKYKKEMKGAIREIRRDKDFLAKVKVKETLRNDMQRMEKVKEIFGGAALQQGEIKKLKKMKLK